MFERFTRDARAVVVEAQEEAARLHHGHIGTEHLLLALLRRTTPAAAVLVRHGLTREAVTESVIGYVGSGDLDADALTSLGIDLEAVRSTVEASFGPGALDAEGHRSGRAGHLPFSPRAKKVLELSLREAMALKQKAVSDGHLALGLLREGRGLAAKVLADLGVDATELRQELRAALT
jgi:ATP-dependent Clp protease ATP-binding subunit ClpA